MFYPYMDDINDAQLRYELQRAALWKSLTRDPLDALNDAEALVGAVEAWTRRVFLAAGYEMPAADL